MVVKDFEEKLVKTEQCTIVPVQVVPRGKKFSVEGFDKWKGSLKIKLHENPERGKANKELIGELQKIFNARVEILAGEKQRKKMLLVHAEKKRVLEILSRLKKATP